MRLIFVFALIFLASCSAFKEEARFSCPKLGFIPNTDRVYYGDDNLEIEAIMNGFNGICRPGRGNEILFELTLPFLVKKTESTVENQQLPYFIAVLSPTEEILQEQSFSTSVSFNNTNIAKTEEEHSIRIPLTSLEDVHKYKVVFGFKMTPEQMKRNKEHRKK